VIKVYDIIMKIVVLLLAALVLCQAASVKERLATGQDECLDSMRGNGVCDSACDSGTYKYDNGDCCKKRGFKYNGRSCVAKTNGFY
jgi:hypothetical protein